MFKKCPQIVLISGFVLALGCVAYAQAKHRTQRDRLFELGVALLQYADDYDGKLPVVSTQAQVKSALGSYVQDDSLLSPSPDTSYFAFNLALSGKEQAAFNGKKVVAFYAANPQQKRGILFLPTFDKRVVHYAHNSGFVNSFIQELNEKEWKLERKKLNLAQ